MSLEIKGHKDPAFFLAFTEANLSTLLIMKTSNVKAIRRTRRLVNNQLKSFLSRISVLGPHQCAFKAKHSTVTATTLAINYTVSAFDKGKYCTALFVKFQDYLSETELIF